MYAEEYLPDDANDYFDASDVSIEETSSIDTEIRDRRKMNELYKKLFAYLSIIVFIFFLTYEVISYHKETGMKYKIILSKLLGYIVVIGGSITRIP
jgi:hypothetical protein